MRSVEVTTLKHYKLCLERGEDVLAMIAQFCAEENIFNADVTAIGAIEDAEVGVYFWAKKNTRGKHTQEFGKCALCWLMLPKLMARRLYTHMCF